jgi:hypothetical protein
MGKKEIGRRTLLKGAGAVTLLVVGGSAWRAVDQGVFSSGQGAAYEPWQDWQNDDLEWPLILVKAAILAANPHNTQPWLFRVTASRIEVFADTHRNLGAMDVYLREMHIGLGCAVENMLLAAQANGYETQLTLIPGTLPDVSNSTPILAATLDLSPGETVVSELYTAIPHRHTDRAPYDAAHVVTTTDREALKTLSSDHPDVKVFLLTSKEKRTQFTEGSIQATKDIIDDAIMAHDSAEWFRHSWKDVQQYKDGPYIDTAGVSPMMRVLVKMLPPVSEETENKYWLEATATTLAATPVMGFIAVRALYDRPQALQAGQVWQRAHLWATTQGLSMQPVNQMVEIVDRELELTKEASMARLMDAMTEEPDWKPTFAFRLGYPTMSLLKSPRRSVQEVLT